MARRACGMREGPSVLRVRKVKGKSEESEALWEWVLISGLRTYCLVLNCGRRQNFGCAQMVVDLLRISSEIGGCGCVGLFLET